MENVGKGPVHTRDVGTLLPRKINSKEASRVPRKRGNRNIQGQGHHESPAREYLDHVKCCNDTDIVLPE